MSVVYKVKFKIADFHDFLESLDFNDKGLHPENLKPIRAVKTI